MSRAWFNENGTVVRLKYTTGIAVAGFVIDQGLINPGIGVDPSLSAACKVEVNVERRHFISHFWR